MKGTELALLKRLALLGAVHESIPLTSRELGEALGISQQSASAHIIRLLREGYLARDFGVRRQRLRLTERALELLRREYADYQRIFELAHAIAIHGIVTTGLGEGAFYMGLKGYRDQFREKLWFDPYPGTLNLKIEGRERAKVDVLHKAEGIAIEGFADGSRTYGGAKCFLATIHGVEGAVIMPVRTSHTDQLEVISKYYLRRKLGLKDGDVVEVTVTL